MVWQELSIEVPSEYAEPVSYLFSRYGHGLSTEELGSGMVGLRTYLPSSSRRRLARIEVGVKLVKLLQPMGELSVIPLEDADWETAWKSHFKLLRVGRRLIIKPSWIGYEPQENEVVVELDPGMAFGTGYHPTTRMCLELLEGHLRADSQVLDLGTGSGILSIAAARLGAATVLALDVDPTAVKAARKNIRASGLRGKVHLARGTLPHPLASEGRFNLAMANISAKTVLNAAPHLHRALAPEGILIASGFLQKQQGELEAALKGAGFRHLETCGTDDWVVQVVSRDP